MPIAKVRGVRGATFLEFVLLLPLVIGLMFGGIFYSIYGVTLLAWSWDSQRVAERAVSVDTSQPVAKYQQAICNLVEGRLSSVGRFYYAFLDEVETQSVEVAAAAEGASSAVLTIRRSATFDLLNAASLGVPSYMEISASASINANSGPFACG